MKNRYIKKILVISLLLSGISCGILNPYEVIYKQEDAIDNFWETQTPKWNVKESTIEGIGENMNWAVLLTKDELPQNFKIEIARSFM